MPTPHKSRSNGTSSSRFLLEFSVFTSLVESIRLVYLVFLVYIRFYSRLCESRLPHI